MMPGLSVSVASTVKLARAIYGVLGAGPTAAGEIATKLTVRGMVTTAQQVGVACSASRLFERDGQGRWRIARDR